MRIRKYASTALILVAIAARLAEWALHQRVERARNEALARNQRTVEVQRLGISWRVKIAAEQATVAKLKANLAAATESGTAGQTAPTRRAQRLTFLERIRSDPKVQNLYLEYQRNGLLLEYAGLWHRLNLDSERVAKFIANEMERQADEIDLRAALAAKGLSSNDPEAEALRFRQYRAYEQAQHDLLGDDGWAQLQSYRQEERSRLMVDTVAGMAVVDGIPFTPEQLEQLIGVVLDASRDSASHRMTGRTDWAQVDQRSQAFLTNEQLELIKTADTAGPMGYGWRSQAQLNELITRGFESDHPAKKR